MANAVDERTDLDLESLLDMRPMCEVDHELFHPTAPVCGIYATHAVRTTCGEEDLELICEPFAAWLEAPPRVECNEHSDPHHVEILRL